MSHSQERVMPASPEASDDSQRATPAEATRRATAQRTHAALDRVAVLSVPKIPGLLQTESVRHPPRR